MTPLTKTEWRRHVHLRFPRTLDEAFRTARYGAAIERPWPPLWKRVLESLWRWL